ncbi:MAG: hypothetical protein OXQ90_19840, partial [Gammaproteobacteria bacterium]|nr:hypothetical protein [Gammaproteobacteria bacterium]
KSRRAGLAVDEDTEGHGGGASGRNTAIIPLHGGSERAGCDAPSPTLLRSSRHPVTPDTRTTPLPKPTGTIAKPATPGLPAGRITRF